MKLLAEPIEVWGVTHFHSETGTEGGHWAVQAWGGITDNTSRFTCTKCHAYWHKRRPREQEPKGWESERDRFCPPGEHDWQLDGTSEWSYYGLIVLRDGDRLTIFDTEYQPREGYPHLSDLKPLWEGEIKLQPHELFTEDAQGLWIHNDQEGMDRTEWSNFFFGEYPCRLLTRHDYIKGSINVPFEMLAQWNGDYNPPSMIYFWASGDITWRYPYTDPGWHMMPPGLMDYAQQREEERKRR